MTKYKCKTSKKFNIIDLNNKKLGVIAICVSMFVFFMMPQAVLAAITSGDIPGNRTNPGSTIYGRLFYDTLSPMAATAYVKMEMKSNSNIFLDWFAVDQISTDIAMVKGYTQEFGIAYQKWSFTLVDEVPEGEYLVWVKAYDSNGNLMGETILDDTLTLIENLDKGIATSGFISNAAPHEIFAKNLKSYIDWDVEEIVDARIAAELKGTENIISAAYRISYQEMKVWSGTHPVRIIFDGKDVDKDKHDVFLCRYDEIEKEWIKLMGQSLYCDDYGICTAIGYSDCEGIFAVLAIEKESIDTVTTETDIDDPSTVDPKDSEIDTSDTSRLDSNNNDTRTTDIAGHWAENSIARLMNMNVVTGYPDSTFRPDNPITRAEFTTALVKALDLAPKKSKNVFDDTADHWADEYISTAVDYGVAFGFDEFSFYPDNLITREEAAAMVSRTKQLSATSASDFVDTPDISVWAHDAVNAATSNGIIGGYPDNSFKPQNNATKAEAATMIVRLLEAPGGF